MSKRLAGYDYSQPGFYFVTICTQQHRLVFGTIVDGQVSLKGPGQMAQSVWVTLPRRFVHVKLHEYVFMPNHMHAIVELTDLDPAHAGPRVALWEIVRVFKAVTSYQIRRSEGQPWFAWQEEYYDSVVRTDATCGRFASIFSIIQCVGPRTSCISACRVSICRAGHIFAKSHKIVPASHDW